MFASGQETALLDDTRGRLAQAAIGAFTVARQLADKCRASPDGGRAYYYRL